MGDTVVRLEGRQGSLVMNIVFTKGIQKIHNPSGYRDKQIHGCIIHQSKAYSFPLLPSPCYSSRLMEGLRGNSTTPLVEPETKYTAPISTYQLGTGSKFALLISIEGLVVLSSSLSSRLRAFPPLHTCPACPIPYLPRYLRDILAVRPEHAAPWSSPASLPQRFGRLGSPVTRASRLELHSINNCRQQTDGSSFVPRILFLGAKCGFVKVLLTLVRRALPYYTYFFSARLGLLPHLKASRGTSRWANTAVLFCRIFFDTSCAQWPLWGPMLPQQIKPSENTTILPLPIDACN